MFTFHLQLSRESQCDYVGWICAKKIGWFVFTLTAALLLSQYRTTGRLRLKCRRVVKTAFGGKLTFRVAISSVSFDEAYMKRERRS